MKGVSTRAGMGFATVRLGNCRFSSCWLSSLAIGLQLRGILTFNGPKITSGILEVDPPAMSASQILQNLYSLDTSSPDISRLIYGLIRHDEEERYLSSLQGLELARLIDFLDQVRTPLLDSHLVTE